MILLKKRGLSPVIATMLLVALALILAVIVFLWARSFVGESIQKQGREIEQSCEEVSFRAEAFASGVDSGKLSVVNIATVPLYGVEIRKKQVLGEITQVETFQNSMVLSGETGEISIAQLVNDGEIVACDELIVVPVLLGETEQYKKAHVCDKDYGVEIIVKECSTS